MNVAQHADKILAAWNVADPAGFEFELDNALDCCRRATPVGNLELERQEVLESVVERLRSMGTRGSERHGLYAVFSDAGHAGVSDHKASVSDEPNHSGTLNAGFALLEHLRQRAVA
jgi:hypothetical protein